MKHEVRQKGVTQVMVIGMIVAAVLIIGLLVWGQARNQSKSKGSNTTSSSSAATQLAPNTAQGNAVTADKTHVAIKEWSIEAPYTGKADLKYTIVGNRATFGTDQLTALDRNCDYRGGSIVRYMPSDIMSASGLDETGGDQAASLPGQNGTLPGTDIPYSYVDGYYYVFTPEPSGCGDDTSKTGPTQQQVQDLVKAFAGSFTPAPVH